MDLQGGFHKRVAFVTKDGVQWNILEQIVYHDDVVIRSADEIAAVFEKLKQEESFDDLYPCTEDDLKDVQELL